MKYITYVLFAILAAINVGCDKKKSAINESRDETIDTLDMRKEEVARDAKLAIAQVEENAEIDKDKINAETESIQAQLDEQKRKSEAEAKARKAILDAEN